MESQFQRRMAQTTHLMNDKLNTLLVEKPSPEEKLRPHSLIAAMRHGVLNGGKRLRPFLVMECAAIFGVPDDESLQAACALELLHCYSLIHDDLPAMDDDDLRRGQPTVHKAFDEATAILAGDALLTMAFDLIANPGCHESAEIRSELTVLLARASGQGGMIGGQVLDIAAENAILDEQEIRILQAMKTGALIRFACQAGALLGDATTKEKQHLIRFGELIGLAFQLADDILDVTSNKELMGKAVGKDADRGKGTLVGLLGLQETQSMLNKILLDAQATLSPFGTKGKVLCEAARYIVERKN